MNLTEASILHVQTSFTNFTDENGEMKTKNCCFFVSSMKMANDDFSRTESFGACGARNDCRSHPGASLNAVGFSIRFLFASVSKRYIGNLRFAFEMLKKRVHRNPLNALKTVAASHPYASGRHTSPENTLPLLEKFRFGKMCHPSPLLFSP